MGVFDDDIATAKELIQENGQLVKWRQVRDGDPANPDEPWKATDGADVESDVYICFLPLNREMRETMRYLEGTEVQTGTLMGLMGAVDFEVSLKDVVIRDGKELRISHIDILSPNGQNVLYTMVFKV